MDLHSDIAFSYSSQRGRSVRVYITENTLSVKTCEEAVQVDSEKPAHVTSAHLGKIHLQ